MERACSTASRKRPPRRSCRRLHLTGQPWSYASKGLFPWDGLADRCASAGSPCLLGPALSMKARHGGQAQPDPIEVHTIAVRRRGGRLPQADGYAAKRRATCALRRRRRPRVRPRAAPRAHLPQTHSPDHRPELGQTRADTATREGGAARVPEPAVQQSFALALPRLDADDRLLTDLALARVSTAQSHAAPTFSRLRSSPGERTSLALGRLYASHAIRRIPRLQAGGSAGRLVTGASASAGQRDGPSGHKIGPAARQGASAAAAGLVLRRTPAGPKDRARVERSQGQGKALTVLTHPLAHAVDELLHRDPACDGVKFRPESRRGADEPAASRAAEGLRLARGGSSR
jgi:hypothetical protein